MAYQGSGFTALTFLAYQLVAKIPAEIFLRKSKLFGTPDPAAYPIGDPELGSCDMIFNMAAHWKSEIDLIEKISTSLVLLNALQETGYFSTLDAKKGERSFLSVSLPYRLLER